MCSRLHPACIPGILKSLFQVVRVHVFTLGLVSSFTGADKSLPLRKLTGLVILKGKAIGFTELKQESLYSIL